jgi:formyl-CoA transferase
MGSSLTVYPSLHTICFLFVYLSEVTLLPKKKFVISPLSDIRVLGVTVYLAGPYTMMSLARLGAEAIKIEIPGVGDPIRRNGPFVTPDGYFSEQESPDHLSSRFLKRSQGLKSITLNLKTEEGRKMFLRLAEESDVVLENLSPGAMGRLGLGYEEVHAVNQKIVYASISGYGQTGPYSRHKAHDPQIQGMSGLMDINGDSNGPPTRVGFYIGDLVTPLFACYSILAALREKDKTGVGQYLDVSMIDSLTSLMLMENLEESIAQGEPMRQGNNSRGGPMGLYHVKDGDITLTVASDGQWQNLSKALNAPELLYNPDFATFMNRNKNVIKAREVVQEILYRFTRREALEILEAHNVPCGSVRTVSEVINDRHFWDRGTLSPMKSAAYKEAVPGIASGFPVTFSGGELPDLNGGPVLGMHNKEIYSDLLNIDSQSLETLYDKGII